MWTDQLWICELIKTVSVRAKDPNDLVKKNKGLQTIQVDIPGNILQQKHHLQAGDEKYTEHFVLYKSQEN